MPGSREAYRLAQTLGIGRFVPCFLLFSDSGATTVWLYPISNKSPHEVFTKLRRWVDSFYETNHVALRRWSSVEQSIERAVQKLRTSVFAVAAWKQERKNEWEELRELSRCVDQLSRSSPNPVLIRRLLDRSAVPQEIYDGVYACLRQLEASEQERTLVPKIKRWVNSIRNVDDLRVFFATLNHPENKWRNFPPPSLGRLLSPVLKELSGFNRVPPPEFEVAQWWKAEFTKPRSKRGYGNYRLPWERHSRAKNDSSAIGNVANLIRAEFSVVLETIMAQPLNSSPEDAAEHVIGALAKHLNVPNDDELWRKRTSEYRKALTYYLRNLQERAPAWIIDWANNEASPVCLKDCLPLSTRETQKAIKHLPRLTQEIQKINNERKRKPREIIENLTRSVDGWLSSVEFNAADEQSVWLSLIAVLSSARKDLEERIIQSARSTSDTPFPGTIHSKEELTELLRLLTEYQRSLDAIQFPFENDREVLRVSLNTSLIEALHIQDKASESISEKITASLLEAESHADAAVRKWNSLKMQVQTWSPAGELIGTMRNVLSTSSVKEALNAIDASDDASGLVKITNRDQVVAMLDVLSVQEIVALENRLSKTKEKCETNATKEELYNSILVEIGFEALGKGEVSQTSYVAREEVQTIVGKFRSEVFDVFMAHNALDKPEVLRLSQELRRHGIHPWVDVEQILPGRWFQDVLQSAIRRVKTAAVIIGVSGIGRWQRLELREFVSRCVEERIPLIPVLLPGVTAVPDDVGFLRQLNHVQFKADVTEPEAVARLVWGITHGLDSGYP